MRPADKHTPGYGGHNSGEPPRACHTHCHVATVTGGGIGTPVPPESVRGGAGGRYYCEESFKVQHGPHCSPPSNGGWCQEATELVQRQEPRPQPTNALASSHSQPQSCQTHLIILRIRAEMHSETCSPRGEESALRAGPPLPFSVFCFPGSLQTLRLDVGFLSHEHLRSTLCPLLLEPVRAAAPPRQTRTKPGVPGCEQHPSGRPGPQASHREIRKCHGRNGSGQDALGPTDTENAARRGDVPVICSHVGRKKDLG